MKGTEVAGRIHTNPSPTPFSSSIACWSSSRGKWNTCIGISSKRVDNQVGYGIGTKPVITCNVIDGLGRTNAAHTETKRVGSHFISPPKRTLSR